MTIKSIIAVASGEESDAQLLSVAAKLASHFTARLRVTSVYGDPAADFVSYGAALGQATPEMLERVTAARREAQARLESLARDVAAAQRLPPGALTLEKRASQPSAALARAAVLADLIAFGGPSVHSSGAAGIFAEALVNMRAPCLVVNSARYAFETAAIAWDGSAQAGRAVRAALPLLKAAARVVVLQNADDRGLAPEGLGPDLLADYLERHGVASVATRTLRGATIAKSLLAAAQDEKCELLVAGGYGRPRLYELALGGTTRALVNAEGSPHLLLAH
jgi:nucleotide-binding universal stress UspA family protein